jgi:hypothetical protein
MNRPSKSGVGAPTSVPHASGDEPLKKSQNILIFKCSSRQCVSGNLKMLQIRPCENAGFFFPLYLLSTC